MGLRTYIFELWDLVQVTSGLAIGLWNYGEWRSAKV